MLPSLRTGGGERRFHQVGVGIDEPPCATHSNATAANLNSRGALPLYSRSPYKVRLTGQPPWFSVTLNSQDGNICVNMGWVCRAAPPPPFAPSLQPPCKSMSRRLQVASDAQNTRCRRRWHERDPPRTRCRDFVGGRFGSCVGTFRQDQERLALDTQLRDLDKLRTDPMVMSGVKWTPPWKARGIPWITTRFSLSVKNEQADAGRDGQTCLARPNSHARTGTGKKAKTYFPCWADHEQDWQPYPVDPYSVVSDGYTYIHTYIRDKGSRWPGEDKSYQRGLLVRLLLSCWGQHQGMDSVR